MTAGAVISVVIPCHNGQATLAETIRSALTQEVDKEVIVVDDGSTDRSADIIRSFGDEVRPLFTPNRGASAARDSGTCMARGHYVQYLDSDDLLAAGTLAARLAALRESGADIAYTDWQKLLPIGEGEYAVGEVMHANAAALACDADVAMATSQFWLPPAALMYRRDLVDRIGGWHKGLPVIQDARFLFDAARLGSRFVHVPGIGAYYRVLTNSLSRRDEARFIADCARNAAEIEALWRAREPLAPRRREALIGMWRHVALASLLQGLSDFEAARMHHNRLAGRMAQFEVGLVLRRVLGPRRTGRLLRAFVDAKRRLRAAAAVGDWAGVGNARGRAPFSRAGNAGLSAPMPSSARVLHVPYTYFPEPAGGTEVYVRMLARALARRGCASAVAAPANRAGRSTDDGVSVYRFAKDGRPRLDFAWGASDRVAADNFRAVLREATPRIVHLHARTSAVSEDLIDAAHEAGAGVVFTYHTPTVSCPRGTMMLFGKAACDGRIRPGRCVACTLDGLGVPAPAARLTGAAAAVLGARLSARLARLPLPKAVRIALLIASGRASFDAFMRKVDHVVAVCGWVRDVLVRNGVPPDRITVSRQGVAPSLTPLPHAVRAPGAPLRVAYFGRLDPVKGLDLLVRALAMIPQAAVRVDVYAVRQGEGPYAERFARQVRADDRLTLRPPVPPEAVPQVMARYDLVAVPSRCLETGPLVVHEAFAAGVPVLGARLGGIAELVHDGIDGVLVAPGDAAAWARAIERLAAEPGLLTAMRERRRAPRTMDDAANDMERVYSVLTGGTTN